MEITRETIRNQLGMMKNPKPCRHCGEMFKFFWPWAMHEETCEQNPYKLTVDFLDNHRD